jgi:hypothetical protein
MSANLSRRQFLHQTASTAGALSLAGLDFRLPPVSAAEARLATEHVRLQPEIEPLVRLLEETPRERVLEEFAARIHQGTSYREVLAALLLAGVRNIQPRPVGFKFHAVLVVNSARLASLNSPDADRWLPIFWALDQFKSSQARNAQEGNWTMAPVDESAVPPAHLARRMFTKAMDDWDVAAADAAVAGLARNTGAQEIFELFARYGARDFRDIGHKAIYVANSWRTLQNIGWQYAEPVLRSLAYALLEHEEGNPAQRDATPDRPGRRNQGLVARFRSGWVDGRRDPEATADLLRTLRQANEQEAPEKVVEFVNQGVSPETVWDAVFNAAGELLMRQPGIVALHSVTSANALHYAWQQSGQDETRCWLLLQAASFVTLFRQRLSNAKAAPIEDMDPLALKGDATEVVAQIFAEAENDRASAARRALGYLQAGGPAKEFINTARQLIYLKGTDSHDYKFSEAALEDYLHIAPQWRDRFLATTLFYLRGSSAPDNALVQRTREAFRIKTAAN